MRVLVATNQFQGVAPHDYAHTVEGELVLVEVAECDSPDECGCGRGWPGMASHKATTTAMVADLPHLSEDDLRGAIADWLDAAGWAELFRSAADVDTEGEFDDVDAMLDAMVDEHVDLIVEVCDSFPVGTVLERQGTLIRGREWPAAA